MRENFRKKVITLCGVQGCCPTVEFRKNGVVIKDDFGGKVKLSTEQLNELGKIVSKGK